MSKWISSSILVFAVAMSHVADGARAADFKINPQAARFVLAILLDDFRTAQTGGGYMFSYAPNESEASLRMKVQRWLSGHDPDGLDMDPSERQTLFKFYWAASMMPKRSTCFVRMESESCRQELTKWMSREAAADPRFLLDYKTLAPALGLPALAGAGGS
ncbi:hypothetical protein AWB68_05663 [Caballeronia choica]|uniref:Uncharacterized protein n=1 Tax=Caballeronia choica TaxID=326476 RepID=A0A158KFP8_9BURK|nr:hypothetical protein [Caballeronia choica]SAL79563.1 hypothetical protein AWB68_05663 [Caballeronia choica]